MNKLSPQALAFLRRLDDYGGACDQYQTSDGGGESGAARQQCRRRGLAEWARGYWRLTAEGLAVVRGEEP